MHKLSTSDRKIKKTILKSSQALWFIKRSLVSDISPDDVFINESAWELLSIVFLIFLSEVDIVCIFLITVG